MSHAPPTAAERDTCLPPGLTEVLRMKDNPLCVEPLCHADHFVVFLPRSSNHRREMQVSLLLFFWLSVCLHVLEFGCTSLQGELCEKVTALSAHCLFCLAKKYVDHHSMKDQSDVWMRVSRPMRQICCSTCSINACFLFGWKEDTGPFFCKCAYAICTSQPMFFLSSFCCFFFLTFLSLKNGHDPAEAA